MGISIGPGAFLELPVVLGCGPATLKTALCYILTHSQQLFFRSLQMVFFFQWTLSGSKTPLVSRILRISLVDLKSAGNLDGIHSYYCTPFHSSTLQALSTITSEPTIIDINVTIVFHFFSVLLHDTCMPINFLFFFHWKRKLHWITCYFHLFN